jgi:hypothetical protein
VFALRKRPKSSIDLPIREVGGAGFEPATPAL